MRVSIASVAALGAALLVVSPARLARACGGFFCDNPGAGQPPMPVDQSGETILFFFDGENVEAHIQIQYVGDPEKFAWLIPLQATPEVSVGSAQLFLNLLNGTVPTVTVTPSFDLCNSGSSNSSSGSGCSFGGADDESASFGASNRSSPGGPTKPPVVDAKESVGAFEVNVLSGSSVDIQQWLLDNGYLPNDKAPAIVDDYASRGYVFAAIKLRAGAGLDELHPLVVKYRGSEPCIPLKLTAIAATEDMSVRAFFLGARRTVPTSYRHVNLNFARFDWATLGQNYTTLVSRAVDSPAASGRAFITEYAGTSSVVSNQGLFNSLWQPTAFSARGALDVIPELTRQGLLNCTSAASCVASHAQVLPLLRNHLPAPLGLSEADFWANMRNYVDRFDPTAFDPVAFSQDMDERIVKPGRHAQQMLAGSRYVTRLFTTISPGEMTDDPEFVELPADKTIGDVSPALNATDRRTCDGQRVMNVPDGREVAFDGTTWPRFKETMPWATTVEEFSADGTRIELASFEREIDSELKAWNVEQGYDPVGADRERLSEASGGGACACQMQRAPTQGVLLLFAFAFGLLRRFTSPRRGRVA